MKIQKIPVFLLTGYLGSGKTTLLKAWLQSELLKDAALIINELGEVGLDNQLLTHASESAALLANACVCCSGLPALNQALEDLFWARLERTIPRFPNLVIETTGVALPSPILASFEESTLIKERYECMGTITCLSASTATEVLHAQPEAREQLKAAKVCILTKTDLASEEALQVLSLNLQELFAESHHDTPILMSKQADLTFQAVLKALHQARDPGLGQPIEAQRRAQGDHHGHIHEHHPSHAHSHDHKHPHNCSQHQAQAYFWPIAGPVKHQEITQKISALKAILGERLLRLKGRVCDDQGQWLMQLAPFEKELSVQVDPVQSSSDLDEKSLDSPWGLTLIVSWPLEDTQREALLSIARLQA